MKCCERRSCAPTPSVPGAWTAALAIEERAVVAEPVDEVSWHASAHFGRQADHACAGEIVTACTIVAAGLESAGDEMTRDAFFDGLVWGKEALALVTRAREHPADQLSAARDSADG